MLLLGKGSIRSQVGRGDRPGVEPIFDMTRP